MKPISENFDVVVVGGGPAGSTAASIVAQANQRVVVLEKDYFPRYHIGESLIPFCYFPLERIGMIERLKASHFPKKYSVQFVSQDGNQSQPFYFHQHIDHPCAQTWQVRRSEFDTMMRDNAIQNGVDFREGWKVRDLLKDQHGATIGVRAIKPGEGEVDIHARVVVDASGRDALSQARNRWRVNDRNLQRLAIWSYFKGAKRDAGMDEGSTTVAYVDGKNWFWYIPLPDDVISVGVVGTPDYLFSESRDLDAIFKRELQKNRWLSEHVASGEQMEPARVTSDYSYRSEFCAADGLVLAGDSVAFLDPVFSSGMFFALFGGMLAGDAVVAGLQKGDVSARAFSTYATRFHAAFEAMRKLVYSFYEPGFNFGIMLRKYPELRGDVTDILIGNVEKDFTRLFEAMAEFIPLPEPLPLGKTLESSREPAIS